MTLISTPRYVKCQNFQSIIFSQYPPAVVAKSPCSSFVNRCDFVCFFQGFELMLLSLSDPSERVVSAVHQVFIPAFAAWTTELGTLQTALIPSLLTRIEKLLMVCACLHVCLVYWRLFKSEKKNRKGQQKGEFKYNTATCNIPWL